MDSNAPDESPKRLDLQRFFAIGLSVAAVVVAVFVLLTVAGEAGSTQSTQSGAQADSRSLPTASEATARTALANQRQAVLAKLRHQNAWQAVNQIRSAKLQRDQLLSKPVPQPVSAGKSLDSTAAGTLSACPDFTVSASPVSPNPDQVVIQPSPSQGPAVVLESGTGYVSDQCRVFSHLKFGATGTQSDPYVAVGSNVAFCLTLDGTCRGGQDVQTGTSKTVVWPNTTPVLYSVLDTVTFLRQWNSCIECNLRNADLSGLQFPSNTNLMGADLSGAVLYNTSFPQAIFDQATFGTVDGTGTQFAITKAAGSSFVSTNFDGATFDQTDFSGSSLRCPTFKNTVIAGIDFSHTDWSAGPGGFQCETPHFSATSLNLNTIDISVWPQLYFYDSTVYTDLSTYQSLASQTLTGLRFVDSQFLGVPPSLTSSVLSGTTLDRSVFQLSDLSSATLNTPQTSLIETDFTAANLDGADLSNAVVPAQFDLAYLADVNLDNATLELQKDETMAEASFNSSALLGTSFRNAWANNVDFGNSYIWTGANNADFDGSTMRNTSFASSLISNTTFNGQTDLTGANFSDAQCISCDFTDAKLDQSNWIAADIFGSTFAGAKLTGANFTNSACCATGTWSFNAPDEAGAPNPTYQDDPSYPNLSGNEFDDVASCPSGRAGQATTGCKGLTTPLNPPSGSPACLSAGGMQCPQSISLVGGTGQAGYNSTTVDNDALDAEFNNPTRVLLDHSEPRIFVSDTDNHRVRTISGLSAANPIVANLAGNGQPGNGGDGGAATSAQLSSPQGLAQYPAAAGSPWSQALVIADSGSNSIRIVEPQTGKINTFAGSGTACADPTSDCGDGQTAHSAQLSAPHGVWFDPNGNLYIADTGNHKVRRLDAVTNTITTVAGTGSTSATATGSTNDQSCDSGQPATTAAMNAPVDLTGDSLGNLYVVDSAANALYKIDPHGCMLTFADSGKGLQSPTSIGIDQQNQLYVANSGANTVITFSLWGIQQPLIATGVAGYAGDDGPSSQAQLNAAQGISVSPAGTVYIADTANQRIRISQPPH